MKHSLLLLNQLQAFNRRKLDVFLDTVADVDDILCMSRQELSDTGILTDTEITRFIELRDSAFLQKELEGVKKEGFEVIDLFDERYPALLKETHQPPLALYVRGDAGVFDNFCFAVVGSRLATLYGISMAEKFSYGLSSMGIIIVSGLARGIDTAAHKAALREGRTIAVLGSGLCNVYPKENRRLYDDIARNGAVVSEFGLYADVRRENFPRRNRIISGVSKGVLVVEAAQKSGALITARFALEQNREVFAVPGRADSALSRGTNSLIKAGAVLAESVYDILDEFGLTAQDSSSAVSVAGDEKSILDVIDAQGAYLEEIIRRSGKERGVIDKAILTLQMKGFIQERTPLFYTKNIC